MQHIASSPRPQCSLSVCAPRPKGRLLHHNPAPAHHSSHAGQQQDQPQKWWTADDVAVVTGGKPADIAGNKGVGFQIARKLVKAGFKTVLTARDEELGKLAVQQIQESTMAAKGMVEYHLLELRDPTSVAAFVDWLKDKFGGVTILINNAGIAFRGDVFGAEEARHTLDVNFTGTAAVCTAVLPILKPNARIINVSSSSGSTALRNCSSALQQRFLNARSYQEITTLADEFVAAIRAGTYAQDGWPGSMYGLSKLVVSMYTRVLAEELKDQNAVVNAVSPGYCATDMTGWKASKSAEDGADTPAWLALLPPDVCVTGRFFKDRTQLDW